MCTVPGEDKFDSQVNLSQDEPSTKISYGNVTLDKFKERTPMTENIHYCTCIPSEQTIPTRCIVHEEQCFRALGYRMTSKSTVS